MANPQPTQHTRISNELYAAIIMADFSKRQRKIIDLIIRMSYGCGRSYAILRPIDFTVAGMHKSDICKELKILQAKKVIHIKDDFMLLNKDYEKWEIDSELIVNQKRYEEILHRNLSLDHEVGKTPTLENEVGETPTEVGKTPTLENEVGETPTEVGKTPTLETAREVKHLPESRQNTYSEVGKTPTDTPSEASNDAELQTSKESIKERINNIFVLLYKSNKIAEPECFVKMLEEIFSLNYPFNPEIELQLFRQLQIEFPSIHIADATKHWILYNFETGRKYDANSRKMLRGWCDRAVTRGKYKRNGQPEPLPELKPPERTDIADKRLAERFNKTRNGYFGEKQAEGTG